MAVCQDLATCLEVLLTSGFSAPWHLPASLLQNSYTHQQWIISVFVHYNLHESQRCLTQKVTWRKSRLLLFFFLISNLFSSRWQLSSVPSNTVSSIARAPDGYERANPSANRVIFSNSSLSPNGGKNKYIKIKSHWWKIIKPNLRILERNNFEWCQKILPSCQISHKHFVYFF